MFAKCLRLGLAGVLLIVPVSVSVGQPSATAESLLNTQRSVAARVLGAVPSANSVNVQYAVDRITRDSWSGQDWQPQTKTEHMYTGFLRTATHDHEWSPSGWVLSFRTSFYENGLIRAVDLWDPISQTPTPVWDFYYEFAYDLSKSRQVLSLEIEREWDGVAWQNRNRTTYDVRDDPAHGLLIVGGQIDTWDSGDWSPVEQFSFDESEGAVVQEYRAWDGAGWVNTDRIVFPGHSIASLADRIEALTARYGDLGELYLSALMIPPYVTQQWTGSDWENDSRQEIEAFFYPNGEPSELVFSIWNGQRWIGAHRLHFQFSLDYEVTSTELWITEDAGCSPPYTCDVRWVESKEVYARDGRHLIVEMVRSDRLDGVLQTSSRISLSWIGLSVSREELGTVPVTHVLRPAYPNPFNPTTTITYELAATDDVRLELRDMLGRLVDVFVDERQPPGSHKVLVQVHDLPSGIYAVRMLTSERVQTQLLSLVK